MQHHQCLWWIEESIILENVDNNSEGESDLEDKLLNAQQG